jgi:hypothetical protein
MSWRPAPQSLPNEAPQQPARVPVLSTAHGRNQSGGCERHKTHQKKYEHSQVPCMHALSNVEDAVSTVTAPVFCPKRLEVNRETDLAASVHLCGFPIQFWDLNFWCRGRIRCRDIKLEVELVFQQVVNIPAFSTPMRSFLVGCDCEPVAVQGLILLDILDKCSQFLTHNRTLSASRRWYEHIQAKLGTLPATQIFRAEERRTRLSQSDMKMTTQFAARTLYRNKHTSFRRLPHSSLSLGPARTYAIPAANNQ